MRYDKHFNVVTDFLALHDYQSTKKYDLILVLGSAIPSVSLAAYELYKNQQASYFMIAGGIGHTTDLLLNNLPLELQNSQKSEAMLLRELIEYHNGKDDSILLEQESTNCGLNIAFVFEELKKRNITVQSVLLCHDPLLQRRIDLTAKKQYPNIEFSNFCAFIPEIRTKNNQLELVKKVNDQWPLDRYISLTLGEIARVIDNENGYGPKGANYLCHIDLSEEVLDSYRYLLEKYEDLVRS